MSQGAIQYGDTAARLVSQRIGGTFATRAELKALGPKFRVHGMLAVVMSDLSLWVFNQSLSTAADAAGELLLAPASGSGRWVRADKAFVAKLAISHETLDAALLWTIPEGFALRIAAHPWWEVTTAFSGGSSSTIGISSNVTGYDTKGDLLGGASGDAAATLGAGIAVGTIGPKLDSLAEFQALLLEEGNAIRFDRITSAFTGGAGFVCLPVIVASAPATP